MSHPREPGGQDYAINMIIFIALLTMAMGIVCLIAPGVRSG